MDNVSVFKLSSDVRFGILLYFFLYGFRNHTLISTIRLVCPKQVPHTGSIQFAGTHSKIHFGGEVHSNSAVRIILNCKRNSYFLKQEFYAQVCSKKTSATLQ